MCKHIICCCMASNVKQHGLILYVDMEQSVKHVTILHSWLHYTVLMIASRFKQFDVCSKINNVSEGFETHLDANPICLQPTMPLWRLRLKAWSINFCSLSLSNFQKEPGEINCSFKIIVEISDRQQQGSVPHSAHWNKGKCPNSPLFYHLRSHVTYLCRAHLELGVLW